jgi:hypothetical protein
MIPNRRERAQLFPSKTKRHSGFSQGVDALIFIDRPNWDAIRRVQVYLYCPAIPWLEVEGSSNNLLTFWRYENNFLAQRELHRTKNRR